MNSIGRFTVGCCLATLTLWSCNSVDRSASDEASGASGGGLAGAERGGAASSGAPAAQSGAAGHGVGKAGASGSAAAGASAGVSAGGAAASAGVDTSAGGAAGAEPDGDAGAGAGGQPPVVLLQNPSFELGGLAGWQVVVKPDNVGKAIYTQWGSPTGESIDGMFEVSFWNGNYAFTGDLHQVVTGLTPGKYELKAYIAFGTSLNAAYLYAIGCGPTDVRVDLPLTDGAATFAPFSIPTIDVTGDTCTVGLFVDANTGDWLNADAFVFDALPAP